VLYFDEIKDTQTTKKQDSTFETHSEAILNSCSIKIKWNSAFLPFLFIIEGTSKKVLKFLMPLGPIYNKNFCFNEENYV
jgi:hypothetical protein